MTGLFFYHDLASLSHSTAMLEITFFLSWSWHVKMKRPLTILHRSRDKGNIVPTSDGTIDLIEDIDLLIQQVSKQN